MKMSLRGKLGIGGTELANYNNWAEILILFLLTLLILVDTIPLIDKKEGQNEK